MSVSTAESGSSSTTTRALVTSARASATRWRWPPERLIAALADQRVVAVRQLVRERVDARGLARGEHLVPVRVVAAGGEVLAQRHGEEHRPLRDERDVRAKLGEGDVARVDAADEHAAAGRVVEARQEVEQRGLARAGRSADGDDLARLDDEVDAAQHLVLAAVREVYCLEAHAERAGAAACFGAVGLGQRLDPLEPREAPARRRERALRRDS